MMFNGELKWQKENLNTMQKTGEKFDFFVHVFVCYLFFRDKKVVNHA